MEAELDGKKYAFILDDAYRWQSWAAPKDKDGKLDHNKALTGDDLRDFVNQKLFPDLHGFKQKASRGRIRRPDTRQLLRIRRLSRSRREAKVLLRRNSARLRVGKRRFAARDDRTSGRFAWEPNYRA